MSLAGIASSDTTNVTWVNNRGGSGTATGTAQWTVTNCVLQEGVNVVTATAHNGVGTTDDVLTATLDTTPPTITIQTPTSNPTVTISSAVGFELGGVAADNVGLESLFWHITVINQYGAVSGTTNWTTIGLGQYLVQGLNPVVEVTAIDLAGNTATDTITITVGGGGPTPPAAPTGLHFT